MSLVPPRRSLGVLKTLRGSLKTLHGSLKTLHGKLSLILLGLLCLVGCLSVPLTLMMTWKYQQEEAQRLNRPLAAGLAAHLAAAGLLSPDPGALGRARAEIKRLMVINPNIDVYLLDGRGSVLACSADPARLRRSHVALAPLRRLLGGAGRLPILDDDPRSPGRRDVFSVAAAPGLSTGGGYVYVILSGPRPASVSGLLRNSSVLRSGAGALVALPALAAAAGLLLFRGLTRRLRWLTQSMETFRDQNYTDPDSVLTARLFTPWADITPPRDEIDRLGLVHLQMTNRIRGQVLALAQADARRRETLGGISHDLRTPLAALHGSLETLLIKDAAATEWERRDYLQAALRHSGRLTRLIDALFELARLDSPEMRPRPEAFPLDELVRDAAQPHALTARRKGVSLEVLPAEGLPLAHADIALIERVLANLLENAVRHTPEGGAVAVSLAPLAGGIEVRVADTGGGIRHEDLPHIFECSYQATGRPERAGAAGLGLAIVKRILELHGGVPRVESVPGRGTTFAFLLPAWDAPARPGRP